MEKSSFEKSLRLTKLFLSLSGIRINATNWSKILEKCFDYYVYYFQIVWLYMDIFGEINWLIEGVLTEKSFIELSLAIPCITVSLLATSKSIFLFLYRDTVLSVVDKLREIHPEYVDDDINKSDEFEIKDYDNQNEFNTNETDSDSVERHIVKESTTFLRIIVSLQYYICAVVVVAFPLMPVMTMVFGYYNTGILEYKYPYMVKYFFDPFKMELWPFVYFHQVISTAIVGMNVFGSDTLFYSVCIFTQMHFRILCHRFKNVVGVSESQTREKLTKAVVRHQELIGLVDQVELLYSKSTLFNIVTSSVLICLSGFIITTVEDIIVVVTFATFLFMNLSQISLLCFFGDLLMRSSTEISTAIYNSLWYNTDQRIKKSMFLILMRFDIKRRAQKPCKLTACNFADLNLTAFTTILSRSWSYFALLKTMYKD